MHITPELMKEAVVKIVRSWKKGAVNYEHSCTYLDDEKTSSVTRRKKGRETGHERKYEWSLHKEKLALTCLVTC